MSKHLRMAQLWCLGLVCAVAAHAAESTNATKWGGNFEGGFSTSWTPSASKGSQFMVDNVTMGKTFDVTDKTKVVVDNSFHAYTVGTAGGFASMHNSVNYTNSNLRLTGTGFALANRALYLQHNCSENFAFAVGHVATNFGMESMMSRYDMHTYFYSYAAQLASYGGNAFAPTGTGYGWASDLGLKMSMMNMGGNWHISLVDGRTSTNTNVPAGSSPAVALNWNYEIQNGDMSFTPVLSVYAGKFRGSPRDLGFSGGLMSKFGAGFANLEFAYLSRNASGQDGSVAAKDWSFWVEPGYDFGMFALSAKVDFYNTNPTGTGNSNINVGAAVSHEYADKYRVKLAYMHNNLSDKTGFTHANDIRLLFGTKW